MNAKFLGDSPTWGIKYHAWVVSNDDTDKMHAMEKQVQTRGREFVHVLLTSFRRRLQPYWSFLMACQMANPCSPRHMPQSARDAVKDLCLRAGMSDIKSSAVVEELDKQRSAYSRASAAQERRIHRNLRFFYATEKPPIVGQSVNQSVFI